MFAIAGALLAFGASAVPASAAPAMKTGHERLAAHLAPPRVINLHREYRRALRHVRPKKIFGVIFPRGKQPKMAARVGAGCSEPACPLSYNGGPVQHHPRVYLVMWGPNWQTDSAATFLENFYGGLGVEPQDSWSTIAAQYGDGGGYPSFSGSTLVSAVIDLSTPPQGVTQNQLAAEADATAAWFGISDVPDSQIVIATQSGTWPQCFNGVNCTTSGSGSTPYCGWHAVATDPAVPYINLPYQPDAFPSCGWNLFGPDNGFSITGGHEYAETVTDPYGTAWFDPAGGGSEHGEIGDKCESASYGNVTLSTGTFRMQPLWSNGYAHDASGCILSSPPEDTVTVANPGNQSSTAGSPVNLAVAGASGGGFQLAWDATGLPPGLSVNAASGLISGTPTTPGEYTTSVTASDMSGASASAQWTWRVGPDSVTVTNPGTRSGSVGIATSLQAQGSSIEGYPLTWSAQGLPPGLSVSPAGLVSGTPATAGTYPVSLTATDSAGTAGSATFTWTISLDGVVVTNPGTKVSLIGRATGLQIKATSSQGYPLTYRATGLPPGLAINTATGLIGGTGTTTGGYSVTVTATDSAGESGSATFAWDVASLPPPCGMPRTRTGHGGLRPVARTPHSQPTRPARSHLPIC